MNASALTADLLRWVDARPRRYDDTIEAWKTSCPRLSIWDDAVIEASCGSTGVQNRIRSSS